MQNVVDQTHALREPKSVTTTGLGLVKLDVISDQYVAAAACICSDATVIVDNAGIAPAAGHIHVRLRIGPSQ